MKSNSTSKILISVKTYGRRQMMALLLACATLAIAHAAYAQFTFTNIECPGGGPTTARGINNHSEIVGQYAGHAVLIKYGQCTPLAPTTVLGTSFSEAMKNNDRGDVVGYFVDDNGAPHGFLLTKKGVLTTLDFPGAGGTGAYGINESGTVVGFFDVFDGQGNFIAEHGFTWDNGSFAQVDYPGSANTSLTGINARGDMVGEWDTSTNESGFVRTKHGEFINYNAPIAGAVSFLTDINANGETVGLYGNGKPHGLLQVGSTFTSIDYPDSRITTAWGINSSGQIVGTHNDNYPHSPARGYLAVRTK